MRNVLEGDLRAVRQRHRDRGPIGGLAGDGVLRLGRPVTGQIDIDLGGVGQIVDQKRAAGGAVDEVEHVGRPGRVHRRVAGAADIGIGAETAGDLILAGAGEERIGAGRRAAVQGFIAHAGKELLRRAACGGQRVTAAAAQQRRLANAGCEQVRSGGAALGVRRARAAGDCFATTADDGRGAGPADECQVARTDGRQLARTRRSAGGIIVALPAPVVMVS